MLCSYGCGQEAKFQLRNGKWICSKSWNSCSKVRRKLSFCKKGKPTGRCWNKGKKASEETRRKMSIKKKGKNHPLFGIKRPEHSERMKKFKHSKETKEKLRLANLGHKISEETREKFRNKIFTEETRRKLSEAGKGRKHTNDFKLSVRKRMLNGGAIIAVSFVTKESRRRQSEYMKNGGAKYVRSFPTMGFKSNDEWFRNGGMNYVHKAIKNPSGPELKLRILVKELYPTSEHSYKVLDSRDYEVDIVIPELKIVIEYDGTYWHRDKEKDLKRQKEIENQGWRFIRYLDFIPSKEKFLEDVEKIIKGEKHF